ncbi:MAG: MBL fold metallo-hydrolase, partial [Actinomycetota bacterium]
MDEPLIIDTHMHGHPELTGAFVIAGEKTALVETGPRSTVEHVLSGLEAHGVDSLDLIVVTHIHLDHAGAAGTLAARFPGATVCVHPVGAPHLVDPSKLWSSAARIYGADEMEALWGGIDPLPSERLRVVEDGDVIDLGGRSLTAYATPGHAGHHHVYLDDRTGILFAGDALGVRLPGVPGIRPTTPPPEFDLELALTSIERVRGLQPHALWFTHYGPTQSSVDEVCAEASAVLRRWAGWVEEARRADRDLEGVTAFVRARARAWASADPAVEERLESASSYRMNASGYMRYFDKRSRATAG